jgi:hypothetical protein
MKRTSCFERIVDALALLIGFLQVLDGATSPTGLTVPRLAVTVVRALRRRRNSG